MANNEKTEGILKKFMQQLTEDNSKMDEALPQGSRPMSAEEHEVYVQKLRELRNSEHSPENVYQKKMQEMVRVSEKELFEKGKIESVDVSQVKVLKAFCPQCGKEVTSLAPTMFNPYTQEKVCRYTCPDCGAVYNFEHAYPRFVFLDKDGNIIEAFGD